jgi:two-component system LytT family response regulator
MLRAALVDDEPLGRERIRTLLGDEPDIELAGEYCSGDEAVEGVGRIRPHLFFLDVQMPGLDGFGVVKALERRLSATEMPIIVFVTAFDEYALRAFDVSALDYLLKPFDRARFRAALGRARVRATERFRIDAEARFVVRSASKIFLVKAEEVDWIEGDGNYARLHVNGRSHLVRETLKSVEARLAQGQFVRVHRSAIVNVDRVAMLQPHVHGQYRLVMKDGARLTSSRTHSAKLRSILKRPG